MFDSGFRLSYEEYRKALSRRLQEPPPGRLQLLTGPRQVGKTTLLLEIAESLGDAAVYAAGDAPEEARAGVGWMAWEDYLLSPVGPKTA